MTARPTSSSAACGCDEFSRAQLLRSAAARAGQGLPDIEPGMPAPAGTGLSRRQFLLRSAGAAVAVYGVHALSPERLEYGIAAAQASAPSAPVIVSVFMEGGVDSLSLLAPVGDSAYRKLRPKLALNAARAPIAFSEDGRLRWNKAAEALARLHQAGKVSVLPAVGYTSPDQSHFTSRHFWQVGQLDVRAQTGWLGRYLDLAGSADNPLQGVSLSWSLAPELATGHNPVAAFNHPTDFDFWTPGVWGDVGKEMLGTLDRLGAAHAGSSDSALAYAGRTAAQTGALRSRLETFGDKVESPVVYPQAKDDFPRRLAGLAAMLTAGLPIRAVAVDAPGGYDTHSKQEESFDTNVKLTFDSLEAFQADLEARGLADRVIVMVWSEFGRRPEQNGSEGTDHGAAGSCFVIGSRVAGKMVGEFPGLERLDKIGNLRATSDFRGLYAAILEGHLGVDASRVIPGAAKLARPRLFR